MPDMPELANTSLGESKDRWPLDEEQVRPLVCEMPGAGLVWCPPHAAHSIQLCMGAR